MGGRSTDAKKSEDRQIRPANGISVKQQITTSAPCTPRVEHRHIPIWSTTATMDRALPNRDSSASPTQASGTTYGTDATQLGSHYDLSSMDYDTQLKQLQT